MKLILNIIMVMYVRFHQCVISYLGVIALDCLYFNDFPSSAITYI